MSNTNRWGLAAAGFLMQMALGAVYAWSVFRMPLTKQFHWSISQVTLTFTICVFVLGVAAFLRRPLAEQEGAARCCAHRRLSLWAGRLSGQLFRNKLWWLYLSYGFIGGIGLGLRIYRSDRGAGEVVSRSAGTYHRHCRRRLWRRSAGHCSGGYALIQSVGVLQTFAYLGIAYLVVTMATGFFMQNPPDGWKPAGWTPSAPSQTARGNGLHARRRAQDVAMVGAVGAAVPQHLGGHLAHLTGVAHVSGDRQGQRRSLPRAWSASPASATRVGRIFWAWISDASPADGPLRSCSWCRSGCSGFCPASSSVAVLTVLSPSSFSCATAVDLAPCRPLPPTISARRT